MEYKGSIPIIGDNRYNGLYHKPALDILRIEYYKYFGKDLSINEKTDDNVMFYNNISEFACKYLLRGPISSIIMLDNDRSIPQKDTSLNWKLESRILNDPLFSVYFEYMKASLVAMNGLRFNFIYSHNNFDSYYLSYIPVGEDKPSLFEIENFLRAFMDKSYVNVIWLDNELLAKSDGKDKIVSRIKLAHEEISELTGIDCEKHNEELLRKKLTLF